MIASNNTLEPKTVSLSDSGRKEALLKSKSFQKEPLSFASETSKQLRIRKLAGHDQGRVQFSLKGGSSDSKLPKSSLQLEKTRRRDATKKKNLRRNRLIRMHLLQLKVGGRCSFSFGLLVARKCACYCSHFLRYLLSSFLKSFQTKVCVYLMDTTVTTQVVPQNQGQDHLHPYLQRQQSRGVHTKFYPSWT